MGQYLPVIAGVIVLGVVIVGVFIRRRKRPGLAVLS
jgi:LPXTG-motif cell wall-anchored protein